MSTTRRQILGMTAKLAGVMFAMRQGWVPALADDAPPFLDTAADYSEDFVRKLAEDLSKKPYQDNKVTMPPGFEKLTYDQYRDIRFNPDKSIWKGQAPGFSFDLFHSGFLYTTPVDIFVVDDGKQARIKYWPDFFIFGPQAPKTDGKTDMHYSGLRLRYPINSKDVQDEFVVFQGASYFRAVPKGLLYGLSARGLAIDTGQPTGEEFPQFRSFWVRKPDEGASTIVVEALLDSPSVTGAYKFSIKPGDDTQVDVEMTLFPRKDIAHSGIAPMTSMFLLDSLSRPVEDFRPAVHDSDGLMMQTGPGEWLWRPLANHATLQVSAFVDQSPRGFGLMQRKRDYRDFLDLESKYELRPSLWCEPIGDWGQGDIELFEIPTQLESNDNIVAFWHPKDPLKQGESYNFVYRLHWCVDWPLGQQMPVARTVLSSTGADPDFSESNVEYDINQRRYVIEFSGGDLSGTLTPDVTASAGKIDKVHIVQNDIAKTMRLSFEHDVNGVDMAELRAVLKRGDAKVTETWLFRWTRS
ncbi:glucan biosynthesis protein [Aestuariivirga sp.]|uniref:glucan biosynthesis protein n=1 Tax=Aestuariivirga sp. TaxID=2650926 RepID=UPI0039E611F3